MCVCVCVCRVFMCVVLCCVVLCCVGCVVFVCRVYVRVTGSDGCLCAGVRSVDCTRTVHGTHVRSYLVLIWS